MVLLLSTFRGSAADWPGWRGPKRDDHSPDTNLLRKWPEGGPKRVWLFENAGLGYAGYSIVAGKLFTIGLRGDEEFLIALNTGAGTEIWAAPVGAKYPNRWGDGPRATPTVDGERVYALGGQGMLICAQAGDGKVLWQKSMTRDLGGEVPNWGYAESVLIVDDKVICTPGGAQGTMAALDKLTGAVAWRSTSLTDGAQYASPILAEHVGRPQVIQLVQKQFFGVDLADGRVLWRKDWPGKTAVIPTPVYHDGHVYITSGYQAGCTLVKLGPENAVTEIYANKNMVNHHGGVVLVDGHIYGHSYQPRQAWVCQNFKTGERVWESMELGKGAVHHADGMLYCLEEDRGTVALVEASTKGWTERGRFTLAPQTRQRSPSGKIWTHPVVIDGRLYLRDQELLFCYDVRGS